jgi:hypothetical protein
MRSVHRLHRHAHGVAPWLLLQPEGLTAGMLLACTQSTLRAWRAHLEHRQQRRRAAVRHLQHMAHMQLFETAILALRFWARWATHNWCSRRGLPPPHFSSANLPGYGEWLERHNMGLAKRRRAEKHYQGALLRRVVHLWDFMAWRCARMRAAWDQALALTPAGQMRQGMLAFQVGVLVVDQPGCALAGRQAQDVQVE